MITVAITGGTGFIGRALVDAHRQRGDRVRVLTRRPGAEPGGAVAFEGDLAGIVPPAFADEADVVYHLAAEIHDASRAREINTEGTRRLLRTAMGRCGHWVQLSSVGVYGPPRNGLPIDERSAPCPASAYEHSKLEADLAVQRTCIEAGCSWGIVRPSNVVGASMRNQSAFALVRSILQGRFAFVGSRRAVSTYIHVEDVVRALIMTATAPDGTIVNVSSDCLWTSLVERICVRSRCPAPRVRMPETLARALACTVGRIPGFPLTISRIEALARTSGYPTELARQLLGFTPTRPMPEGFDDVTDAVVSSG